ncbi:MAG: hypothetical protein H6983_10630 [Ectothiorhodospiraceae bacterium]|nr:hypothetical protein [Chromatiales bacterium]MCP5154612.1 hypothetical protein [Ectothiorhodospiraceae bacterium]
MNPRSLVLLATVLGAGASAGAAQAATIAVDMVPGGAVQASRTLAPGDSFSLDIVVSDVADLAGFELALDFDPAILGATSLTSGLVFGPLDTFPLVASIGVGTLAFAEVSLAPLGLDLVGPTVLATVSFDVLAAGTTALDLHDVLLSDSLAGAIGPVVEADGQLTAERPASTVDEPLPLALLAGGGLLGLVGRRRHGGRPDAAGDGGR